MARYNPYNRGMQYPDMQENTQVPYLSYYDPQQVERLGTVIQQRGQRYDASQAAIAKYLEDAGATEMRGPDRDAVIAKISSELDAVKGKVKERYNGDYGLAVNDVIQGLSKSSGIYKQAGQKYKEEQKYLPLYTKLKSEGKLVTPKGALNPFEQSSFDESTGRFKDLDYSQMYERNDYTGWNKENISKRLNDTITNNTAEVLKNASTSDSPYLLAQKIKGKSQEYIIANKDKIISDGDVKLFMEQNPTFAIEHGNDKAAAKQFMFETTLNQVSQQIDPEVITNQYWLQKQKDAEKNKPKGGAVLTQYGLTANPKAFDFNKFYDNSPNGRAIISSQQAEPLKQYDVSLTDYTSGKVPYEAYQTSLLEKKLRENNPELNSLYGKGIKTNDEIVKGFKLRLKNGDTVDDYQDYVQNYLSEQTVEGTLRKDSPEKKQTDAIREAISNRNDSAKKYSNNLEKSAKKFIETNGTDLDYQIPFYSPDYSKEGVSTTMNHINQLVKDKVVTPGQFQFLDDNGGLRGKTPDKINEKYKDKEFKMPSVGGNFETGLIWKVINPDGTVSNAKWNTGYEIQRNILLNGYGSLELVGILNASTLDFKSPSSNNGESNIKVTFPDAPATLTNNIRNYKLTEEPKEFNSDKHYLKSNGKYIKKGIDEATGKEKIFLVDDKESATDLTKLEIFDLINQI